MGLKKALMLNKEQMDNFVASKKERGHSTTRNALVEMKQNYIENTR